MPIDPIAYRTAGQLVGALLADRGWSQRVLAAVLGVHPSLVGKVVKDERPVDAPLAITLSTVFGVPAETFLHLQRDYDLAKARLVARPDPALGDRARLLGDLPVSEMITRGWLVVPDIKDVKTVEAELARFFGVPSFRDIEILPHAAKRTNVTSDVTPAQLAWLYRVRQIAKNMVVPPYATDALLAAIASLQGLTAAASEARRVPRILADAGVRFVVVESLTAAKIDGVCFWLDDRSPVIGMSLRYDRIDNFWFVLRHECEHVLRGHGRAAVALDAELERERAGTGPDLEEQERVANEAASRFCVPSESLQQFIARKDPIYTRRDILGFSKVIGVHPGLVAGQLQRATGRYERFREHLEKIRSVVLPSAMHDGWGDVAPVGL